MTTNVATTDELTSLVASLMQPRTEILQAQIDILDQALIDADVRASQAFERADSLERAIRAAMAAAGADEAQFTDAGASKAQARKRRIEKSGFMLIQGGGESS